MLSAAQAVQRAWSRGAAAAAAVSARFYARPRPRMIVTLLQDVPLVGNKGQVVIVKSGHARNYLIPRQLAALSSREVAKAKAIESSPENMARRRRAIALRDQVNRLAKVTLTFHRRLADPNGNRLQTPISADAVAAQLERQLRFRVPVDQLVLEEGGISRTGTFSMPVKVDKGALADLPELVELNVPDTVNVTVTVRA